MRARSNPGLHSLARVGTLCLITLALASCGDDDGAAAVDASTTVDAGDDSGATPSTDAGDDSGADDAAPPGDTWAGFAEGFFATYCTECHNTATRDYRTIDQVRRDATLIRCGTTDTTLSGCATTGLAPRQFPVGTGPRPSDADRARLVAWIDAGMP